MLTACSSLIIAVCDPSLNDLALTRAAVRKAMDAFSIKCRSIARAYPTPEALLAARPCDICVTELELGTMDGFTLADAVRKRRPGAEVIFTTRCTDNAVVLRAWQANIAQYFLKPIETERDFTELRRVLGKLVNILIARPSPADGEGADDTLPPMTPALAYIGEVPGEMPGKGRSRNGRTS